MINSLISIFIPLLFSTTIYITGHLKNDAINEKPFNVSGKQIIVKVKNKVIAKSKTDKKGNFDIQFTVDSFDERAFDFYVIYKVDTLFIKSINEFESDTPDLILYVNTNKK